jgi:pimeloyl-ACP methyl ester carboxylesterase
MKVEAPAARTRHTITVGDGTEIFFKDWRAGQPIVFSHGSPLNSDAWEDQMVFLADRGCRCIAHDRRGHGRSSQPWTGNDVDTYAADLAALVEELDLHDAVHVGHSTGAGEVVRYIARHGTSRVAKVVLIGAVTPLMLKNGPKPRWPADRSLQRHARRRDGGSVAVPQGVKRAVLRGKSTEREGVASNPGRVLAPRHAGRNPGHPRLH